MPTLTRSELCCNLDLPPDLVSLCALRGPVGHQRRYQLSAPGLGDQGSKPAQASVNKIPVEGTCAVQTGAVEGHLSPKTWVWESAGRRY